MTENITKSTANVGVAGSTIYLVVVMSVDDATMDVVDYNLSLDLKFDYGKTTENPNGIAQDDWDGTVGTLPTPITATSNATLFNQYVTEFNMNRSTDRTQMADVDTIYVIKTAEELAAISAGMPEGSSTETYYYATGGTISAFVLEADIDLKNIPWTPIGYGYRTNAQKNFNGIGFGGDFYGNGHTIRNISIEKAGTQYGGTTDSNTAVGIGFFGNLYASKIVGLTLANIKVTGNQYVGAVAGYALSPSTSPEKSGRGEITDCHVTDAEVSCICANTEESGDKAGAICGYFSQTTIKNCSAYDCAVDADRDAGMLLGCLHKALDTYFTAYIFTDNIAHNVTVKSNNTGKVVLGDSYTKSGGNIGLHENGLIGRI